MKNPAHYECIKGVPIFKAHSRTVVDPESGKKQTIRVDKKKLEEIVANTSKFHTQHGVPLRITDGHIKPGKDEKDQPPLFGFAMDTRMGTFGPSNETAILTDLYIRRDRLEKFKERPFRSAELYPGTNEIRGVAGLIKDPQLDLGFLAYNNGNADEPMMVLLKDQNGERYLSYSMENSMPAAQRALEPIDDLMADFDLKLFAKDDPEPEDDEDGKKKKMREYAASIGYTGDMGPLNVSVPSTSSKKKKPQAMSCHSLRDDVPELFERVGKLSPDLVPLLEAIDGRIMAERQASEKNLLYIKDLFIDRERSKCERLLDGLVNYSMDRDTELSMLLPMKDADREKRVAYIKTHYVPIQSEQIQVGSGPLMHDRVRHLHGQPLDGRQGHRLLPRASRHVLGRRDCETVRQVNAQGGTVLIRSVRKLFWEKRHG